MLLQGSYMYVRPWIISLDSSKYTSTNSIALGVIYRLRLYYQIRMTSRLGKCNSNKVHLLSYHVDLDRRYILVSLCSSNCCATSPPSKWYPTSDYQYQIYKRYGE